MLQVRSWLPWFKRVAKGRILFVSHQLTLWVYMCVCLTVTGGRLKVRFCVELHIDVVVGVWCEFIGIYAVVSISQIGIWFACQKEVRLAVFVSCGLHEFVQSHSLIILSAFIVWCGASLERWIRELSKLAWTWSMSCCISCITLAGLYPSAILAVLWNQWIDEHVLHHVFASIITDLAGNSCLWSTLTLMIVRWISLLWVELTNVWWPWSMELYITSFFCQHPHAHLSFREFLLVNIEMRGYLILW